MSTLPPSPLEPVSQFSLRQMWLALTALSCLLGYLVWRTQALPAEQRWLVFASVAVFLLSATAGAAVAYWMRTSSARRAGKLIATGQFPTAFWACCAGIGSLIIMLLLSIEVGTITKGERVYGVLNLWLPFLTGLVAVSMRSLQLQRICLHGIHTLQLLPWSRFKNYRWQEGKKNELFLSSGKFDHKYRLIIEPADVEAVQRLLDEIALKEVHTL